MSNRPRRRAQARAQERTAAPARTVSTADSYVNPYARMGFGQPNMMEASEYPITRLTQNYALLNSMYRNDWLARRIIDTIPEDMTKNWYEIKSQIDPDLLDALAATERMTGVRRAILEGLRWGRLFGGAAGVIILEGQEDMLDEPLDLRFILPGQFKGILIADRWSGVYPGTEMVEDLADPDFGLPEYYYFSMTETGLKDGIRVHHSRILRFTGRELPFIERMSEVYWGMSEIEHVYSELNKRNATSENIAQLIFRANICTYKMSDLGQVLMTTTPEAQRDLYQTMSMQNFLLSSMGMNVMDKDDDFVTNQYSFSGVADVYELFMLDVAGAARIPVTKLFGRSPAGMNSTGESDLRNYYDEVRQEQESKLRPILDKLLPILCISTWGAVPDDLDYEFRPIRDTSDEERANLIQQSAAAITSVYQSGIISQQIALKELRQSGAALGMWSNITDEDIDAADSGIEPMDELGGLIAPPGGAPGEPAGPSPPAQDRGAGPMQDAAFRDDGEEWITVNGTHIPVGEGGKPEGGPARLQRALGKNPESAGKNAGNPAQTSNSKQSGAPRAVTPNIESLGGKAKKQAHEMSNAISKGSAKVNAAELDKHRPGTSAYNRHVAMQKARGYGVGTFSCEPKALVPEIQSALKSGKAEYTIRSDGSTRVRVDLGHSVGTSSSGADTGKVTIVYSEKRGDWHFFPDD